MKNLPDFPELDLDKLKGGLAQGELIGLGLVGGGINRAYHQRIREASDVVIGIIHLEEPNPETRLQIMKRRGDKYEPLN